MRSSRHGRPVTPQEGPQQFLPDPFTQPSHQHHGRPPSSTSSFIPINVESHPIPPNPTIHHHSSPKNGMEWIDLIGHRQRRQQPVDRDDRATA